MSQLPLPLVDAPTAAEPTRDTLRTLERKYGFLPNLYRVFTNAPSALNGYLALSMAYEQSTLSPVERNVVLLAVSRENGCHYCVAVHSTVADMQKAAPELTEAIRNGTPIADPKLEALRRLAQALVKGRGYAGAEIAAFLAAGYRPAQVLEVLVGLTLKTLSNYTNHLSETPLDPPFAARAWKP